MKVRNVFLKALAVLIIAAPLSAWANQSALGWCEQGAQKVSTQGLQSSTFVQASYPSCIVTVFTHGVSSPLPSIFSDNVGTVLANPFTAGLDGRWQFFAANGHYDVTLSGGGLALPITFTDVLLNDPLASSTTTFGGAISLTETVAPAAITGFDLVWADSGIHRLRFNANGSSNDSIVGANTADIFTNKAFDTAATGNALKINGTALSSVTGAGAIVLQTSPTINTPTISAPAISGPTITGTVAGAGTYASPTLTSPTLSGAVTISGNPTVTGNVAATAGQNSFSAFNLDGIGLFDGNNFTTLQSLITSRNSLGGEANAEGQTGAVSITTNPYNGITGNKNILLKLGSVQYQTTASWLAPPGMKTVGIGTGNSPISSVLATSIQAVSGFPASTPVLQTATGGNVNGFQFHNITVDCNGQTGATGIKFNDAQETSEIMSVSATNCPGVGIDIGDGNVGHSQNSGPFMDLTVNSTGSANVAGTIGIRTNMGGSKIGGMFRSTTNFTGAATAPNVCNSYSASGLYEGQHVEGCGQIGFDIKVSGVVLVAPDCGPFPGGAGDCIRIEANVINTIILSPTCNAGGPTNLINDLSTTPNTVLTCANYGSTINAYYSSNRGNGDGGIFFDRFAMMEGTAPGGVFAATNQDACQADSIAHGIKCSFNNDTFGVLARELGDLGGTASSPQVIATHLSSALPVNQGGTGQTVASTFSSTAGAYPTLFSCGTTTTCSNTALGNSARVIIGTCPFSAAATCTVISITAFTSVNSYVCNTTEASNTGVTFKIANVSAQSFTITASGAISDTVGYICGGN